MNQPEMRREYDFSTGARGKYAEAAKSGTNLIRLDDDVAEFFSDSKAINDLLRIIVKSVKKPA